MEFRKVYVLREIECSIKDLGKQDIFRLCKASPKDAVDETKWWRAISDPYSESPEGNWGIQCEDVENIPKLNSDDNK